MRTTTQILEQMQESIQELLRQGTAGNTEGVCNFVNQAREDIEDLSRIYNLTQVDL